MRQTGSMHIMTVCLGNICRSPAAEAVLINRLEQAGLDHVTVSSAGTADYHVGSRPHELSRAEGEARGYRFQTVGAQFTAADLESADLILVMDESNGEDVRALARNAGERAKVVPMGAFAPDAADTGARAVPDPYGHPREAFAAMYDQLEEAVDGLVAALQDGTVGQIVQRHAV